MVNCLHDCPPPGSPASQPLSDGPMARPRRGDHAVVDVALAGSTRGLQPRRGVLCVRQGPPLAALPRLVPLRQGSLSGPARQGDRRDATSGGPHRRCCLP